MPRRCYSASFDRYSQLPLTRPWPQPCYAQVSTAHGQPPGFDRVRHTEIGDKNVRLKHLEEAFTSVNWIVRIYKVLKPANRE